VELLLSESGVRSALLHGGTCTTYAIGLPLDQSAWRTSLEIPAGVTDRPSGVLTTVDLRDNAIAVSAVTEKSFTANGKTYGHVIDPRTGWPAGEAVLSAAVVDEATVADVWSTALMVLGGEGLEMLRRAHPTARGLVLNGQGATTAVGFDADPAAL